MSAAFQLPDRFWSKVNRKGDTDCWEWTAAKDEKGYGLFRFNGRVIRAHRLVLISLGHDMVGMQSMHSCDHPPCCNPGHLSPGTLQENQIDSVRKGRRCHLVGDKATNKKLTEEKVRRLRIEFDALPRSGGRYTIDGAAKALASDYGITYRAFMYIVTRQTWRHV